MMLSNSDFRDTSYDRETLDETLIALAEAFHALLYPTPMLIPSIDNTERRRWPIRAPSASGRRSRTALPPRQSHHGV